jgi:hypothetical protein
MNIAGVENFPRTTRGLLRLNSYICLIADAVTSLTNELGNLRESLSRNVARHDGGLGAENWQARPWLVVADQRGLYPNWFR